MNTCTPIQYQSVNAPQTTQADGINKMCSPLRSLITGRSCGVERNGGLEGKFEVVRERIYVGGLQPGVTGDLLSEVFSQFGQVIHSVVIAGRNFGFVTFSSTEAVDFLLDQREPVEVAGSRVTVRQARRQLWKEEVRGRADSKRGPCLEFESSCPRTTGKNFAMERCSLGDIAAVESKKAEWQPFSLPQDVASPPFEDMILIVSLQPMFPGHKSFIAPSGQLVYPVDSFPVKWGTPGSCAYLGSVDISPCEVSHLRCEEEVSRRDQIFRKLKTIGDGRRGTAKGELCSRREPRTFGKWMAASKTEKKAPKKKRSGRFNAPSHKDMALSKGSADGSGGESKMKESVRSQEEGTGHGDHILS